MDFRKKLYGCGLAALGIALCLFVCTSIDSSPLESITLEEIYAGAQDHWTDRLKAVEESELKTFLSEIASQPDSDDKRAIHFASALLCELHVRPSAKADSHELKAIKEILSTDAICFAGTSHSIEAAGIRAQTINPYAKKGQILHPYSQAAISKKMLSAWMVNTSGKSLSEYIATHATDDEKRAFVKSRVKYLGRKDRKKYRVTFSKERVKIGHKYVKDGKYIFALSADGETLLAGVKKKGSFHHSSFFSGYPVQCAGGFYLRRGKIVEVILWSGHYKPSKPHGELLRKFLSREENLGAQAAEELKISPYR